MEITKYGGHGYYKGLCHTCNSEAKAREPELKAMCNWFDKFINLGRHGFSYFIDCPVCYAKKGMQFSRIKYD